MDLLKSRFFELIEEGKVQIILNMEQSNYVSSLCLAVIVDVKNHLVQENGDLRLCKVNRLINNLLEITNLVKMIQVYGDIEDAVASFEK